MDQTSDIINITAFLIRQILLMCWRCRLCDNVFLLSSFVIVSTVEDTSSFRAIIPFRICAKSPISSSPTICTKPSIFVHLLSPRCSFMIIIAHRYFLECLIATELLEASQVFKHSKYLCSTSCIKISRQSKRLIISLCHQIWFFK